MPRLQTNTCRISISEKRKKEMTRMIPVLLILFSLPAYAQLEVGGGLLDNCK